MLEFFYLFTFFHHTIGHIDTSTTHITMISKRSYHTDDCSKLSFAITLINYNNKLQIY